MVLFWLGKIDGHYKKNDLPVLCREELLAVRVARDHLAPPLWDLLFLKEVQPVESLKRTRVLHTLAPFVAQN